MTLAGFLDSFGLEGKIDHEPTGCVTKRELAYGRRDVERTVALLNAMKHEIYADNPKLTHYRALLSFDSLSPHC